MRPLKLHRIVRPYWVGPPAVDSLSSAVIECAENEGWPPLAQGILSIETGGSFDLDAELKIWISGTATPIQKQFTST